MIQFDELYYIQKFSIFDKLRIKINKRPKQRSMQYRQDSRLKTNQSKKAASQGLKIQQIVYDKEIVQQWKVKTDNPKQILAYSLRHFYLQRLCDAWHQIKFLYFQNYHEVIHKNHSGKIIHQSYEESDIQVVYSSERIQQCKTFIKKIWKLTRQRILNAMNKIKIQAGFDQDQSLQVEEDLNQYMRFLKLQQNKRIDIAIQNLDSVVEKNTRRKLLNAFLNMREKMKRAKRSQFYRDKIRLECFVEICIRNLRKLSSQLIFDSFISIFEYSEGIRVHREQIRKRKLQEERLIKQQKQRQDHYRSISNRKEIQIHEDDNENQDTVEKKQKRTNKTQTQQIIKGNNFSTVKRQHQSDRVNIINVFQDNHEEEHQESNQQHVVHSNYYYDELQQQDYHGNSYQNQNLTNMNNLKTKRSHNSRYNHHENQYQGNDLQTNINSAILNKKTARTPSRSDIKHNTFNSAQIHEFSSKNYNSTHSRNYQEQLHIPITQRIQKHHESHYEEETHEQKSSSSQQQKVYQQICVIRNFVQTPKREPDRFEKIPVLSNNIEFKQFFLNSKSKSAQRQNIHTHTSSFYERKQCENCYFCTKLKNIKSIVEQFQRKKHVQTTSKTEINQKVIVTQHLQSTQTQQPNYQADKVVNTSQNLNLSSNQQFNQVKIVSNSNYVQNHSQNNHHSVQIPLTNIIKDATNLQVPVLKQNREKIQTQLKSTELMRSPHFIGKTSPKPQIIQQSSAILERSRNKSQHQSQRKIFARKPMH